MELWRHTRDLWTDSYVVQLCVYNKTLDIWTIFNFEDVTNIPQEISFFGAYVCWISLEKAWSKGEQKICFITFWSDLIRWLAVWLQHLISMCFLFSWWGAKVLFWSWTHSFAQESLGMLSQMSLGLVGLNAAIIILHFKQVSD